MGDKENIWARGRSMSGAPINIPGRSNGSTFTSFPEDRFSESSGDPKTMTSFYNKFRSITSAASSAMQSVLKTDSGTDDGVNGEGATGQSPFSGARAAAIAGSPSSPVNGHHQPADVDSLSTSPLRYIHDPNSGLSPHKHKASPTVAGVTSWDEDERRFTMPPAESSSSGKSYMGFEPQPPRLSRTASANTSYSYNPRDHLPGYSMERDPSSDSESITSGSGARDLIMTKIDPAKIPGPLRAGGLGKEFWMKDENATECFKCGRQFTAWRRKHHCRLCGQIFCSSCTTLTPGEQFNYQGRLRACLDCLEVIEKYASSSADSLPVSPTVEEEDEVDDVATTTDQQPMEISFENAPQPTPMMAIPATKKGESLEIFPSSNNNGSPRTPNSRIRPSTSSQNRNRRRAATIDGTGQRSGLHNLNNHLSISGDEEVVASDDDRLGTASDVPERTHDESEEEDEQAMSLFTALNFAKVEVDQRSETNSRSNFLRPRSGTTRSVEQGKTSLMRIGQRRKTFSSNGRRITLSRSKSTMNPDRLPLSAGSSPKKGRPANGKIPQISGTSTRKPMSSNVAQAPSIDLNKASINHAKAFLDQLLWNFELSTKWNTVLVEPLLQCAQNIDLNVKGGDSIDIRHYVKLKRIPGGTLKDTRYVDGIVFSKSLALKSMPRMIDDPKILLITFPIEYSRAGNHFMSLDPVIAQETEYLRKLVRRITALRPDVILAGDRVSGIALKMLDDHGIAVATGVKSTVINRVARYTQADIISSIDKLAMNPTVGRCLRFEVNTYRYKDMVKTFMFFSGIPKELGCTILLRGSNAAALAKVKAVTEFMVYVVFNLKLETSLMRDEFVLIPSQDPHEHSHYVSPHGKNHGIEADTGYFHDLLKMQAKKIMSSSPFVHFGNPYFFQEARDLEDRLVEMSKENEALDLSDEAIINEAYLKLNLNRSLEELPGGSTYAKELIKAVNNEKYLRIHEQWTVQKRQWEQMYAQFPDMFDPSSHQNIVVLFSIICNETATPCVGPEKMTIDFYSENDATLGQFVEHICETTEDGCPDECGRPLNGHYRSYVHGRGRINVIVEKLQSRLPGYQDTILMWSYCKECKNTTPIMPMSGTTWKYSFGKYLELSFWSDGLSFRAGVCDHDIYRDHIRYFGFHDMAVRFEYDSIGLLEVVAPKAKVTWDPEKEICHKLEIYDSVINKVNWFWGSVANRLNNVIIEGLDPEKIEECKAKVEELRRRCEEERVEVIEMVKQIYLSSRITDFLPLNGALRTIQDKVVTWDNEFIQFENNYLPSEKDVARITAQQLKKIFVDKQDETTPELVETPASEKDMRDMKADVTPPISSASSAIGKYEKASKRDTDGGTSSPKTTDTASEHASPKESEDYVGQRGSQSTDCLPSQSIPVTAGPDKDSTQPASKLPVSKLKEPTSVSEPVSRVSSPRRESPGRVREEVSRVEENLAKNQSQRKDEGYFFRKPTLDRVPRLPTTPELEVPLPIGYEESRTSSLEETVNRAGQNRRTPEELYRQPIPHEKVRDSSIPTLRTDKLDQRRGLRQRSDSSTENNKSNRASSGGSTKSEDTKAVNRPGRSSEESARIVDSKVRATPVQSMRSDKSYARQNDRDGKKKAWNEGAASQNPSLSFRKRFSDKISFPAQTLRQRFGTSTKELEKQLLKNRQPGQTKVSSLAKHFDQLSREFEKERAKERNLMEQGRVKAFPVARARPIVEVFKNVEDAVEELSDNEDDKRPNTSSVPLRTGTSNEGVRYRPPPSHEDAKKEDQEEGESNAEESHAVQTEDDLQETDKDTSLSNSQTSETLHESAETRSNSEIGIIPEKEATDHTAEKQTLMQTLARFWADRTSSGWASLDYPMNPTEHIFADSDIIIREDEPSSLIAFCLNSPDYLEKLRNMGQSNNPPQKQAVELDELVPENASTYINDTDSALESQMLKKTGIHLKYQFQEGSANLSCKIFFSEQFDAFRKQSGCDEHYVQSLSRCVKWDSSGGKSGSAFLKTLDDRLVVKQLSQSELDAFVKFAPSYFEYMAQAFFHVLPTVLAKIFGFYQIQIRNSLTGKTVKMDLIVMENLFYNRKMSRIFDLKGSMRNRHVQQTGKENEVLLDENMVEYIYESPLFVREYAKRLLRTSLFNDTLFLAKMNVMDYSLVIGIDEDNKELVVGIIDFIRTFTWDKKLESWVKERGLVGGGVKEPTVVSPRQYKNRFREAMERYILMVPDCWYQE